ncbi:DUF4390 domain-containing protein [Thiohalocapsa sp. ML1]|uniref:DUF4390 domain-containing protein n=1 Tax=Thiohalocapsa sp. ML1 TaxID=1431688 RepID=UPI0007323777|nr:DUF4390 domain-containing protein [Thiohalocapsa sp. ML1]
MRRRRHRLPALLAALLLLLPWASAATRDFAVENVETRLADGTLVMDANVRYEFSERALEALDNGVPLTVEVHLQVRAVGDWIWRESLLDRRLRYRIRYRPLSERYLVSQLPGEAGRTYVTRDVALTALGELRGIPLLSPERLAPEQDYELHVRVSLDVEELPLPLRPMAYLYPSWKQSSKWTAWPLRP